MIDLKPFCGIKDARWYLNGPFSLGEYSYATNGCVIVRVPRRPEIAEVPEAPKPEKLFAEHQPDPAAKWFDVPELPKPEMKDCLYCNDDVGQPCEECNGTGKVEKMRTVDIGDVHFQLKLLRLLKSLPNCKIIPHRQDAIYFTFDGGDGLLMPMICPVNPVGKNHDLR